jgi:hypothetical protein
MEGMPPGAEGDAAWLQQSQGDMQGQQGDWQGQKHQVCIEQPALLIVPAMLWL